MSYIHFYLFKILYNFTSLLLLHQAKLLCFRAKLAKNKEALIFADIFSSLFINLKESSSNKIKSVKLLPMVRYDVL